MLSKGAESVTDCKVETSSAAIPAGQSAESVYHRLDDTSKKHIDSGKDKRWFQYSILMKRCFQKYSKKSLTFLIYSPESGTVVVLQQG